MAQYSGLRKECLAEFFGIFIFMTLGCAGNASITLTHSNFTAWEGSMMWGVAVALAIYIFVDISGAHFNPSVTIAFWLFNKFPKQKVLPYLLAQTAGAFLGVAVVYGLYFNFFTVKNLDTAKIFMTDLNPALYVWQAFLVEMLITAILVTSLMGLNDAGNRHAQKAVMPLLVGLVVATIGCGFGGLTGWSMNAARDVGPRLFLLLNGWGEVALTNNRAFPYIIVTIFAPTLGGVVGAFIYKVLFGYIPLRVGKKMPETVLNETKDRAEAVLHEAKEQAAELLPAAADKTAPEAAASGAEAAPAETAEKAAEMQSEAAETDQNTPRA